MSLHGQSYILSSESRRMHFLHHVNKNVHVQMKMNFIMLISLYHSCRVDKMQYVWSSCTCGHDL